MQLHLIFCLLHVQGQLKTSWSCSLERKDFPQISRLIHVFVNQGFAQCGKASKSKWWPFPGSGNSLLWVCEIRVIPSDAGQSDETWCVFTQLLQVKISPNELKKQSTGIVPKSLTSFAGYWRGVPCQSKSAGVTMLPLAATHSRARGMIGWNWRQWSCQTCYVLTQHDPTCSRTPEDQAGLILWKMNFSNMQTRGFTENKSAVSVSQNQPLWQSPQSAAIFSFAGRIYSSWPTKCLSRMANTFSRDSETWP